MSAADDEDLRKEVRRLRNQVEQQDKEIKRLKRERREPHIDQIESRQEQDTSGGAGMDRRRFLKGLAGGAAGLGAFGMIGNASAFDITSDRPFSVFNTTSRTPNFEVGANGVVTANQVGTSTDPVSRVHANTVSAGQTTTGEHNGNAVNLTQLVDDGTYADIAAAIANEPHNHPRGARYVIEPGTYGPISQQYTIDYRDALIGPDTSATYWNPQESYPVTIEVDDGLTSGKLFKTDSTNNVVEGVGFRGILFRPVTAGGASGVFNFDVGANVIRGNRFEFCGFHKFGGAAITGAATNFFDTSFTRCQFFDNGGQSFLGRAAEVASCMIIGGNGSSGELKAGRRSAVLNAEIGNVSAGDYGMVIGPGSFCHIKNGENVSSGGGEACVAAEGGKGTHFVGRIVGWDVGVEVRANTSIKSHLRFVNNGLDYDFIGGNNSHNGSFIAGDLAPNDVRVASNYQLMTILDTRVRQASNEVGNALPPGYQGVWWDDATITASNQMLQVTGPNSFDTTAESYWTRDGTR